MKKIIIFIIFELIFIFFLDKSFSNFLYTLFIKYKFFQFIVNLGNFLGTPSITTKIVIFLFIFALILKFVVISNNKNKYIEKYYKISLIIFLSFLFSNIITNLVKILTLRERPFFTDNPLNFFCYSEVMAKNIFWKTNYKSFPSGHTVCSSSLFFSLYFIFKTTKKNIYQKLAFIFFLIPFLTALARVALKAHWSSDTFLSLVLGYYISKYIFRKINLEGIHEFGINRYRNKFL